MMGKSHAISGAAAWLAVTSTTPLALGLDPQPPQVMAVGALVCAGAALLPDLDHPSATGAQSVPIIGRAAATAISGMAGGHRHGTHSILGTLAFFAIVWALQFTAVVTPLRPEPIHIGGTVATVLTVCFALKAAKLVGSWWKAWLGGALVGALVAVVPVADLGWLSHALALGFAVHLAGDFLTIGGLPLLWPWNPRPPKALHRTPVRLFWMPNGYYALPILWKTGGPIEFVFALALSAYLILVGFAEVQAWMRSTFGAG